MSDEIIKVAGLTKMIGKKVLLKNVNIDILKGSTVAILGKNGAGKSTLIKCIVGLYNIDCGSIFISGMDWNQKNEKKIKKLISYIPDRPNFDHNLTVEQNILYHASLYGIKERQIKNKLTDLFKFFNLYERKNDTINHYSLGMQKKALIIRGLVSEPRILILDEPTNGLDLEAEKEFIDRLIELNKEGITIILATQSLEIAKRFKMLIYVEEGKVHNVPCDELSSSNYLNSLSLETEIMNSDQITRLQSVISKYKDVAKAKIESSYISLELLSDEAQFISSLVYEILVLCLPVIRLEIKNCSLNNYEKHLRRVKGEVII